MNTANKWLSISLSQNILEVDNNLTGQSLCLNWPAVAISINGKTIRPSKPAAPAQAAKNKITQQFKSDGLLFTVSATLDKGPWLRKSLKITRDKELPTPDYVEVDCQELNADNLELCGYRSANSMSLKKGEEEGGGIIPGCGYPLIGENIFIGLEHPAAFCHMEKKKSKELVCLKHYPVWDGDSLEEVDEVLGLTENATEGFADYLDSIRLPMLKKPFVSFCTFWTDPYIGDDEYNVTFDGYKAFFKAFESFGLIPDAFTLDAGWNDRHSIFQAKKEVGRDKGLAKLSKLAKKMGSALSLWNSHNGHMGIAPEFLKEEGYHVGGGNSAAYCGDGYGVMMDKNFSEALKQRFAELIKKVGVCHFKIDWDNECATNSSFDETHPTRNHVRQASINEYFRIARKLREVDIDVITRNGWWPSPWWLSEASHFWLSDSGDSEYASLPSKTQRDSAQTHRDLMYYNVLCRDKTPVPLDCFDNHEFPDALRNPFAADPASWASAVWLSFMRGSTYIAYTLMPDSLEDWQVEAIEKVMKFCRTYARNIFVPRGRMILGDPAKGEVYGFMQNGAKESWCVLRNPLPVPQKISFNAEDFVNHKVNSSLQFYPHSELLDTEKGIDFLAHELKIVIFSESKEKTEFKQPHMIEKKGREFLYYFPASSSVKNAGPMLDKIHHIEDLKCVEFSSKKLDDGMQLRWIMQTPCRFRNAEIQFAIEGENATAIKPQASAARYVDGHSAYSIPVTAITESPLGHGEKKNQADCKKTARPVYFAFEIPDGGQACITLKLTGASGNEKISAWAAGYEAPSRNGVAALKSVKRFSKCLPYQHPLGFGKVLQLPTK